MAEESRVYDTRNDSRGLSVPAGYVGLYGHTDLTLNEGVTLDGELVPYMSHKTVETGVGEQNIGVVTAPSALYEVTLTVATGALSANDVAADTQELTNCTRVPGGTGILHSVTLLDPDDQGAAVDLYILRSNVSLGTEDSAVSISDENAEEIIAVVSIAATDYVDMVNSQIASVASLNRLIKANPGTRSLYIAASTTGTPTYSGGELIVKLGFLWD